MLSITTSLSDGNTIDYFTIRPTSYSNHFSTETPLHTPTTTPDETWADPGNPLLAYRGPQLDSPSSPTINAFPASILQMQTAASHGKSPSRPAPSPVQNVLHVTSDDSSASNSSSSYSSSGRHGMSSLDLARCSRCQRTPSIDVQTGKNNMVQYGLNLWYCTRCAAMVGLSNR